MHEGGYLMYSISTPLPLARTVNYYTVYVCVIQIFFIFYGKLTSY